MVWTGCIYVLLDNLWDYTLNYYWHIDRIVLIWNMSGSSHKRTDSYRSNNSMTNGETNHQEKRAQWSTQAFTVEEIMQQFNLPQIVKCNQQAILVKRDLPLPINLTQPILLYDKKTIRKLLARNVVYDNAAHHYAENDETIVIPADYEGIYLTWHVQKKPLVWWENIVLWWYAQKRKWMLKFKRIFCAFVNCTHCLRRNVVFFVQLCLNASLVTKIFKFIASLTTL